MTKLAKTKSAEIINAIRNHRDTCALHNMTFSPLPERFKEQMEAEQLYRFRQWWDTWIDPKLNELESLID